MFIEMNIQNEYNHLIFKTTLTLFSFICKKTWGVFWHNFQFWLVSNSGVIPKNNHNFFSVNFSVKMVICSTRKLNFRKVSISAHKISSIFSKKLLKPSSWWGSKTKCGSTLYKVLQTGAGEVRKKEKEQILRSNASEFSQSRQKLFRTSTRFWNFHLLCYSQIFPSKLIWVSGMNFNNSNSSMWE